MRLAIRLVVLIIISVSFQKSHAEHHGDEVDLHLVLAADVSGSMGPELRQAQRGGFASAFRDPVLQRAITSGPLGRIAVTYFEWAGHREQQVIVPWTVLSGPKNMTSFAAALEEAPEGVVGGETSISGAIYFAAALLANSNLKSYRKIVDISGNGRNSDGPPLQQVLPGILANGVTINGLVLPSAGLGSAGPYDTLFTRYDGPLDSYFRRQVIGGPGAFAIAVDRMQGFTDSILHKLFLEISWKPTGGVADDRKCPIRSTGGRTGRHHSRDKKGNHGLAARRCEWLGRVLGAG